MKKQSFNLSKPLLNAAGSLGFFPDLRRQIPFDEFGAFITNPISMRPRKAAFGPRMINYSGGVLLHTGHPNPGLKTVLKRHSSRWGRSKLPVIVHLLGASPKEMEKMMILLEEVDSVIGVEIGIDQDMESQTVASIIEAAVGEIPLMVRVPMNKASTIGKVAFEAGASLISLSPPRGELISSSCETIFGRLYGPSIFSQALEAVNSLASMNIPVVGAGGVYQKKQVEMMLSAGAEAVQLDTVLWRGDFFE